MRSTEAPTTTCPFQTTGRARWNLRLGPSSSGYAPSTLSSQPISMEGRWWPITRMTSPWSIGSGVSAALPTPPRLTTSFSRSWPRSTPTHMDGCTMAGTVGITSRMASPKQVQPRVAKRKDTEMAAAESLPEISAIHCGPGSTSEGLWSCSLIT
uniref:Carboxypeptidase N subunit 1 n=1 Tax=Myotis myotis TaxID=51298 RepID=A0A7J7TS19_MYOMY|nr:carboxypeptidase N subunit 1 [Myotis myotis]